MTNADPAPAMMMEETEEVLDATRYEDLVQACSQRIDSALHPLAWRRTERLLTSSGEWGFIYRVKLEHMDLTLRYGMSYVVCWAKTPDAVSTTVALWQGTCSAD